MAGRAARIAWFTALAVLAAGSGAPSLAASPATAAKQEPEAAKPQFSQRRFYTLEPFTVPLLVDGEIREQFTLVIALELSDEDNRGDIAQAVPRIRNELYKELLHLVTFRRRGVPVPAVAVFKQQLLKVTKGVVGDKVSALLVQQAFNAPLN